MDEPVTEELYHSSLWMILSYASCVSESAIVEVSANPGSNPTAKTSDAGRSALDSEMYQKVKKITCKPKTGKITAFISKEQFLKFSAGKNCLFCFKEVAATEHHLLKRHYNLALHFLRDGIERFVIPCMCSEKIQKRSHWHCPCCHDILTRRCLFQDHIWKKHGYSVLKPNRVTGKNRPSSNEANPSVLEDFLRKEFSSQKERKEGAEKDKVLNMVDVRHIGSSQPEHHNLYQSQAQEEDMHICLEDSSIDKNSGTPQLMETHQNGGVGKGLDSAGKGFSNTGESKKSKGASSSSDDRTWGQLWLVLLTVEMRAPGEPDLQNHQG
ncbi:PREDICTED: uncharacterized protein LOC107085851 [Cyprinodon variegatus]|uniref:uncharacterized protein LOC107085851 n=1 Tax=Cyprinodon variegatus TaxID=28743 RepID=UPI000742A872|nr:PREDICTED: uncharacterized protein LOC107085851 [Cyprinodon variegatus]